jgi:hypothetical protein
MHTFSHYKSNSNSNAKVWKMHEKKIKILHICNILAFCCSACNTRPGISLSLSLSLCVCVCVCMCVCVCVCLSLSLTCTHTHVSTATLSTNYSSKLEIYFLSKRMNKRLGLWQIYEFIN